ncbi:MAG: T9SS type A sorting domain-containing protein [Bacteroidales bacterium]|nr:T9SS type A sorting domain-containing protein [Bacteroidales bacterium]
MRRSFITGSLLLSLLSVSGQTPVGSWSDHLMYNTAFSVAAGSEEIFASNGSSIIVYHRENAQLSKLSRINGLSETGISSIAWTEEYKTLLIAYSSTNVDLLKNNIIYNIPDIYRKYIPGKKKINRIRINGKFAYLACSFGIVVLDILKNEIYDTWKPGISSENPEVWDVAFGNGYIYAATDIGIFFASIDDPGLSYFGNWSRNNSLPSPSAKYSAAIFCANKLYVNLKGVSGDSILVIDSGHDLLSFNPAVYNRSFDPAYEGFLVSDGTIRYYGNDGNLKKHISTYGFASPDSYQAVMTDNDIYIADPSAGLIEGKNMSDFKTLSLSGPGSNNAVSITSLKGKTIITGGGTDVSWNNLWRPLNISVNENNEWILCDTDSISDPLRAAIDPFDNSHFFISTWGGGLLEFENGIIKNQFTEKNSPLQTIIPDKPYVRICGLSMDEDRNLWMTQTEVPGSIKVLKPDGNWIVNPLTIDAPTIGDILITRTGKKWIVLPRGHGIFILDDKGSPDYFADDVFKKMLITTSDDEVISFVYCISEDLDGNIWVGTDKGPVIYYNPDRILDSDIRAFRIKIPRNDGSGLADFMLGTETITSIAVDGANRKWLGTLSSGTYLLSPDGTSQIRSFNEDNSPLFSNSVASVAVDNKSGDVWFATAKGIISYRDIAISGNDKFNDVYAFPNPVRSDFTGNVTITGLMADTRIRITDISGNLVFRTVSLGGQASWNLTTYNGQRVATGVYLVFCSSSDGSASCVIKILVIN